MNQQLPVSIPPQRVPLRVEDLEMLDRNGAFEGYGRVELIEGELLYVNAQYRPHVVAKDELAYRIRRALEIAYIHLFVGTEGSVALSHHDLPQPDILLTSAPRGEGAVPGDSVPLLVEVADTTLPFDLGRKSTTYAAATIPEYWVVDLNGRMIHQMWSPLGASYAERREVPLTGAITAAAIAGLTIDLTGL